MAKKAKKKVVTKTTKYTVGSADPASAYSITLPDGITIKREHLDGTHVIAMRIKSKGWQPSLAEFLVDEKKKLLNKKKPFFQKLKNLLKNLFFRVFGWGQR